MLFAKFTPDVLTIEQVSPGLMVNMSLVLSIQQGQVEYDGLGLEIVAKVIKRYQKGGYKLHIGRLEVGDRVIHKDSIWTLEAENKSHATFSCTRRTFPWEIAWSELNDQLRSGQLSLDPSNPQNFDRAAIQSAYKSDEGLYE